MVFDVANKLSERQEGVSLLSMVFPPDCHPDDNPVFILCRSDTCSFTWTGEEHIHQVSTGGHLVVVSIGSCTSRGVGGGGGVEPCTYFQSYFFSVLRTSLSVVPVV